MRCTFPEEARVCRPDDRGRVSWSAPGLETHPDSPELCDCSGSGLVCAGCEEASGLAVKSTTSDVWEALGWEAEPRSLERRDRFKRVEAGGDSISIAADFWD